MTQTLPTRPRLPTLLQGGIRTPTCELTGVTLKPQHEPQAFSAIRAKLLTFSEPQFFHL